MRRFELQVDPDMTMDPVQRAKCADSAMRTYMGQLAKRRAAKARAEQESQQQTREKKVS